MNLGVIYNGKTVRKKKIQNLSRNQKEERSYVRKPKKPKYSRSKIKKLYY